MMRTCFSLIVLLLGLVCAQERSISGGSSSSRRFSAGKSQAVNFNCPEDFGYYSHPSDCTHYFVCVFGGALLESCTGGLMYSNDLQTCDWPRNVVCDPSGGAGISTVKITDSRTRGRETNRIHSATESLSTSGSLIDRGIDNTIRGRQPIKSSGTSKSIFDDSKLRQGRFISSQNPQRIDSGFQAQETSSRAFNVVPASPTPKSRFSFPPSLPGTNTNRFTLARASTPKPAADDGSYSDLVTLNNTDDYYYYYDDLLFDDYYEPTVHQQGRATPKPAVRAPSRGPSRHKPKASSSKTSSSGGSPKVVGRTPQRLVRPSKKPPPASSRPGLITDIWKYPPRRPAPLYPQPRADGPAEKCDRNVCKLPDCSCGGPQIPGNIPAQNVPQMVLLTFDDSVNDLNKKLYIELFEKGRVNPNGCPISSTFYISHEWTDYAQVQNLYSDGHEIASHSITHSFGEKFSQKKWAQEIGGQREIMSAYGGVKMEDVRGMRAPFLAVGGNNMFRMLYDLNFTYDSSMPVYENNPPSWPYTLDYKIFHDCMIPPCPTNSYPGVWQVPMVMWIDLNGGRCSMGDACTTPPDAEGVYQMLVKNFERHYTSNRAPFGLFYHAAWFTTPHHKEGFIAFLDTISAMDDVWIVTNWQALQWVRDPVPLSSAKSFKPFQCDYPERPPRCTSPRVCNVWHKGSVRYMKSCQQCPESYPWTGKTGVQSPLNNI